MNENEMNEAREAAQQQFRDNLLRHNPLGIYEVGSDESPDPAQFSDDLLFHIQMCWEAGCGHPPYYVLGDTGRIIEGYCDLCRAAHREAADRDSSVCAGCGEPL